MEEKVGMSAGEDFGRCVEGQADFLECIDLQT